MKTDIINIKRFGKYFAADFNNGLAYFGLSALVCSITGIFAYVLCGVFGLIGGAGWVSLPLPARIGIGVLMMVTAIIVCPTKLYGGLTDKKSGSFFTTLPVSSFEKTASMILNGAIIFPLIVFVLYLAVDAILCLIDPDCGAGILSFAGSVNETINANIGEVPEQLSRIINAAKSPLLYIDDVIQSGLIFLLGAICFKKNKVAKTILCLIAFSTIVSSIFSPLMIRGSIEITNDIEALDFFTNKMGWMFNHLVLVDTISDTVVNLILAGAIYFRVKTIKF